MSVVRRWPTRWVFSLLILPLGIIVGFNLTPLRFLLAKAGLPVDQIASMNSIVYLPGVLGLFIAPVVDIKLRRRTWLAIGIFGTAVAACIYFGSGSSLVQAGPSRNQLSIRYHVAYPPSRGAGER
jgi:hypothetical protein